MVEVEFDNFEEKIQDKKYLVDFHAHWCGPCLALTPTLEQVEKESGVPIYKVNIDNLPDAARRYGVRSIPTVILMEDGKLIETIVGSSPKARYLKLLGAE